MRGFLLVVGVLSLLFVTGCQAWSAQSGQSRPGWYQLATLDGSAIGAEGALVSYKTAPAVLSMTDEPARLVLNVSAVYGRGTSIYIVPRSWIESQPTGYSGFIAYPKEFLVATADTTGTTTIAVRRELGAHVLTGPAAGGSGSNFTAILEQKTVAP